MHSKCFALWILTTDRDCQLLSSHIPLLAGSSALDQICSGGVWREHNQGSVERLCLENTKQWQGDSLNSFFIFILAKNVRLGAHI